MRSRMALASAALLFALAAAEGLAQTRQNRPRPEEQDRGRDGGPPATAPPPTDAFGEPRTVEVLVTASGFSPAELTFKKGERIRLVVRRTTEETCAKVLVIDEYLVWNELPLNLPFSTVFTVGRVGEFAMTCPTGEVRGVIKVVGEATGPAPAGGAPPG